MKLAREDTADDIDRSGCACLRASNRSFGGSDFRAYSCCDFHDYALLYSILLWN